MILHIDLDAFFASVEQRENPELKGKPVIVGAGPHERGVVSTCSYEARKFGVRSAMPSRTAYKLCPHGIFVPPDMKRYKAASRQVFAIFSRYTPFVQPVSIDEAFLDISGSAHLFGGGEKLAHDLRRAVREECALTCSAGLAPNRLLAKIASEINKPDGFFAMPTDPAQIAAFLAPRKIGILWGAGKRTVETLAKYGIVTCGDIQRRTRAEMVSILGRAAGASIYNHAFGRDESKVDDAAAELSVSREWTFPEDCSDREEVRAKLLELVADVGFSFRKEKRWAQTVKIKLRESDFTTITRQMHLAAPARDDIAFRKAMLTLFDREWPVAAAKCVRLCGFGVSGFTGEPDDGFFPDEERLKRERLAAALDSLKNHSF